MAIEIIVLALMNRSNNQADPLTTNVTIVKTRQTTKRSTLLSKRLYLLVAIGLVTGCQSAQNFAGLGQKSSLTARQSFQADVLASNLTKQAVQSANVIPVVYNESPVHLVEPVVVSSAVDSASAVPESGGFASGVIESIPSTMDGASSFSVMTLTDFEALALANNPTIEELVATTQKAAGFRTQVSLRANPSIGYQGVQIADAGTDQHAAYISQSIITADKLALNRRVLDEALRAQLLQLEAQKYRIATDIRVKFYDALASQRRVQLIKDFQLVVDKGLELSELRKKAKEGSQLEVVQAKVQKNEIELALQQADVSLAAAWRELSALAGTPQMSQTTLQGELPQSETPIDWSNLSSTMVTASPEYRAAQTRVRQACANLDRQNVQAIPNLDTQLAAGVDNGTNSGFLNVQIGAPIPVFNKNQGNIAAARAEFMRASREVERIENSIKARLAVVSRDYDSSLASVTKYANDILPNAEEGLKLAELAYKAGETSFLQVIVVRRTYFDTNLQYIASQAQLAQARAQVDGYVLTGALDAVEDRSGDDSLRGLTFSQQ